MGLFSSKKKTYVNTSVCRMVEDEDYVPSHKVAMLEYTMSEASSSTRVADETLVDYLINTQNSSMVYKARAARNYASKDGYYYGLPKANFVLKDGVDIPYLIQDAIENSLGHPIHLVYGIFGPMNNLHFLRTMLINKYDYDQVTNELVSESRRIGFTCYLESAVIKYSKGTTESIIDPDTLAQHGYSTTSGKTADRAENLLAPHVPFETNTSYDEDTAVVTVVYKKADGTSVRYNIELNFLEFESSSKPTEEGLDDSDTDNFEPEAITPEVTNVFTEADFYQACYSYTQGGKTHIAYFTYLYGSGLSQDLDEAFSASEEMGQYFPRLFARLGGKKCNRDDMKDTPEYNSMVGLGRKFGLTWTSWVDEVHEAVGSVGSVNQIFMTFAVPANTKDPIVQEYLYEYFASLYSKSPPAINTGNYKNLNTQYIDYGVRAGQTLVIADKGYTQQLSFQGIGYKDILGSIGEVGSFTSSNDSMDMTEGRFVYFKGSLTTTRHFYRKQLTANVYREYVVFGLRTVEFVTGGHTTVASGNSENLLIQLDAAVTHVFGVRDKELLYAKSMHIVLHTVQVVKTKWYQTGVFKAIMFIIAVAISFFTGPGGLALYQAIAYAVVKSIVISLVINMAVKILVVKFNLNIGIVAAVVAVIAVAYGAYVGFSNTAGIAGATAIDMINIANQAFAASSTGFKFQMAEAIKGYTEVMAGLSEEAKRIAERAKELGLDASHNPAMLMFEPPIGIGIRMGESPDDYFQRSIHSGNIGVAVYHLLESSVELNTDLPSYNQILNNIKEIYA